MGEAHIISAAELRLNRKDEGCGGVCCVAVFDDVELGLSSQFVICQMTYDKSEAAFDSPSGKRLTRLRFVLVLRWGRPVLVTWLATPAPAKAL